MQRRRGASSLPRPTSRHSSPTRHTPKLSDISEARPGPNAFAQQAERMERHRFESNAFYQQEMQRRRVTPPTTIHPALRQRSMSEASSLPSLAIPGDTQTRGSTVTTFSPFIDAGKENQPPPLKLVPSPHITENAEPTFRAMIEEREEQQAHDSAESGEERVPVYQTFKPTPKPASDEFVQPNERVSVDAQTPRKTPRKPRVSLPTQDSRTSFATHASKSPKKSFFDRLWFSKSAAAASHSIASLQAANLAHEKMPVKAKAVFGSPSKSNLAGFKTSGHAGSDTAPPMKDKLTRSPSKQRNGLFPSRIGTDVAVHTSTIFSDRHSLSTEETERPQTASSTTGTSTSDKTPQTAVSDPSHDSFKDGKRMPSQTFSDRGPHHDAAVKSCSIARTQSLKYMDSSQPPPTPPSKDTPPHEKAEKERLRGLGIMSNSMPSFHAVRSAGSNCTDGVVSTSDHLSPTRFGSYGQKVTPTLVTQPSMYSLHASVVPDMLESGAFEDLKVRIDGLGLEGFNNPADPETYYQPASDSIYSPSVYNDGWDPRKSVIVKTPRNGHRRTMDDLPTLPEMPERNSVPSHRTAQSTGSGATIPICYPELAGDPSTTDMTPQISDTTPQMVEVGRDHQSLDEAPCHGFSHSRSESRNSALFTTPMPDRAASMVYSSPSAFSQQSAMPSPLQPAMQSGVEYLKPDVYYLPPQQPTSTNTDFRRNLAAADAVREYEKCAIFGKQSSVTPTYTHERSGNTTSRNIMDNVPLFNATTSPERSTSPPHGGNPYAPNAAAFADPRKSGSSQQDKQDQMLQLLSQLVSRNEELVTMREEMRAAQNRMDERIAAMEQHSRSSPSPTPSPTPSYNLLDSNSIVSGSHSVRSQGSASASQASLPHSPLLPTEQQVNDIRIRHGRVATSFAHDFYRHSQVLSPPDATVSTGRMRSPPAEGAFDGALDRETEVPPADQDNTDASAESLEDLRRKNKELTDLVQGFAKDLENMKRQLGKGA